MDIAEVFSSDSEEHNHSLNSEGRETISTQTHKTKNIKKKYEPIMDGGKVYKFEDNPSQYKKLRKKIQNRQSATRVRGRKKNAFENLEQEVEYIRRQNSQLQLINAKLQTENKSLKDQIQYLKTLIKPVTKSDPVEEYLSSEVLTHPSSISSPNPMSQQSDSVLFEEFNWMRTESSSSNFGWIGLAIFTIVLGVFVLPGGNIEKEGFAALQVNEETKVTEILAMPLGQLGSAAMYYGKLGLKYILILGYIWVVFRRVQQFLKRSKIKKI